MKDFAYTQCLNPIIATFNYTNDKTWTPNSELKSSLTILK